MMDHSLAIPHLRILVASDDPELLASVRLVLSHQAHELYVVMSYELMFSTMHEVQPDLILIDDDLCNGVAESHMKYLRDRDRIIGLILCSSSASLQFALKVMANGADGYITKPSPDLDIQEHIRQVMNKVTLRLPDRKYRTVLSAFTEHFQQNLRHGIAMRETRV